MNNEELNKQIRFAADDLIKKLEEVHANDKFNGVFMMAKVHGYEYDGPTYSQEVAKLKEALQNWLKTITTQPVPPEVRLDRAESYMDKAMAEGKKQTDLFIQIVGELKVMNTMLSDIRNKVVD